MSEQNYIDMEMPTPCVNCGKVFDLHDGRGSQKWYPNTVICKECYEKEQIEIERDEEIYELRNTIEDAKYQIEEARKRLKELGAK